MDKIKEFINSDMGRKILFSVGGIMLFLLILKAAAPRSVNIFINNGKDCVNSAKTARKIIRNKKKNKPRK